MDLVFDDRALADLDHIFEWIAQDNPVAAKLVVDRILSSTELLMTFPFMGRAVHDTETFEWVVPRLPYLVVYEIDAANDRVVVVAVFHDAQDRGRGE